jgi:hypothetical protein
MNKKIVLGGIGLIAILGAVGVVAGTTYARGGMMGGNGFEQQGVWGNATSTAAVSARRDAMIAHRDAVNKAIEAGDYTAWKTAMSMFTNGRGNDMTSVITEANFPKFVEMHTLMNRADTIGKEIGLDRDNTVGSGMMRGGGRGSLTGSGRGMMGFRQNANTAVTNQ